MQERIIIAGAGGQGIMLLGKILANAALKEALNVTWFPSYGAEVRGGGAYCMVIISSEDIPSPYIDKADTLITMSEPALLRFRQRIKNKGLLLVNGSLVKGSTLKQVEANGKFGRIYVSPFTEAAIKLGNIKVANMVALGAYLVTKKVILSKQIVFTVIQEVAHAEKNSLIEIDKQAIEAGMRLVE